MLVDQSLKFHSRVDPQGERIVLHNKVFIYTCCFYQALSQLSLPSLVRISRFILAFINVRRLPELINDTNYVLFSLEDLKISLIHFLVSICLEFLFISNCIFNCCFIAACTSRVLVRAMFSNIWITRDKNVHIHYRQLVTIANFCINRSYGVQF